MVKRLLSTAGTVLWTRGLALYGQGGLWRAVWHQSRRDRWGEGAAAVAFFWLLGLLGLSVVLLHLGDLGRPLPPGSLAMARWVAGMVAIAPSTVNGKPLSGWVLALVGLMAGLCLGVGSYRLGALVSTVYGGPGGGSLKPRTPQPWRRQLLPWGGTLLGLGLASLVTVLVAPGSAVGQWAWLWRLGRWVMALGTVGLGLGLVYRLTPRRWVPGLPLWPGVQLATALGLGLLGLRRGGVMWLTEQGLSQGALLSLGLTLATLYGLILLVPMGATVNLALWRCRGVGDRPWTTAPPAPPPSFDSFKINRR